MRSINKWSISNNNINNNNKKKKKICVWKAEYNTYVYFNPYANVWKFWSYVVLKMKIYAPTLIQIFIKRMFSLLFVVAVLYAGEKVLFNSIKTTCNLCICVYLVGRINAVCKIYLISKYQWRNKLLFSPLALKSPLNPLLYTFSS